MEPQNSAQDSAQYLAQSKGWQGSLHLKYANQGNGTKLIEVYSQAPLKVQRSFYPEGVEICHNLILHTAGGIVGGDRLSQRIHLQPNTKVLITTAAASKVYRSNGYSAEQIIQIQVDENACCEFFPRETIVFDGAIYNQKLRVELGLNASFLTWEINRFGRSARGEQFLQGDWRSCTEVWQNGQPLWLDRQWLPGNKVLINSPYGLAGQPIVGTFCWVGQQVSSEMLQRIRTLWDAQNSPGEIGMTQLISGFLCRYRGNSTQDVINLFTKIWQVLRLNRLGQVAVLPRVWRV
ncbi:MAG: urease accessory protein UreD [Microcoleaceae cyanobacterium]